MNTKHPLRIGLVLALGLLALPACRTRARAPNAYQQSDSLGLTLALERIRTQAEQSLLALRIDSLRLILSPRAMALEGEQGPSMRGAPSPHATDSPSPLSRGTPELSATDSPSPLGRGTPELSATLYGIELGQWRQSQQSDSLALKRHSTSLSHSAQIPTAPPPPPPPILRVGRILSIVLLLIIISICTLRIRSLATALRRLAKWARTPSLAL